MGFEQTNPYGFLKGRGYSDALIQNYCNEFGNLAGAAVIVGINHRNLEVVQRFLHQVPNSHIDAVFSKYYLTPEIITYFLAHRRISTKSLNKALDTATSCDDVDSVRILLAQPGVHVLATSHHPSNLLVEACVRRSPLLVEALVNHLVQNSTLSQRQNHLDQALVETARNVDPQYNLQEYKKPGSIDAKAKDYIDRNASESLRIASILVDAGANVHKDVLDHAKQCLFMEPLINYLESKMKATKRDESSTTASQLGLFAQSTSEASPSPTTAPVTSPEPIRTDQNMTHA